MVDEQARHRARPWVAAAALRPPALERQLQRVVPVVAAATTVALVVAAAVLRGHQVFIPAVPVAAHPTVAVAAAVVSVVLALRRSLVLRAATVA